MKKVFYLLLFLVCMPHLSAEIHEMSFYIVNYVSEPPVIDGNLDEPSWAGAIAYTTYYEYYKPNPDPGTLMTNLKMLWDKRGIYIGIINYKVNMANIKAKCTSRDAPDLWKDECAELYFDPVANGIGFTKFTVNVLGTLGDMRQIDTSVSLNEWNASGVRVATAQNADSWNIEMFIPWDDLGKTAIPGDLWKFCHVRYDWSSGKFVGVTSSSGGNYADPGKFGYIYFAKDGKPDRNEIAGILQKKVAVPWCLEIDNELLFCDDIKLVFEKISSLIKKEQEKVRANFEKSNNSIKTINNQDLDKKFKTLKVRAEAAMNVCQQGTIRTIKSLMVLNAELTELNFQIEAEQLSNSLK